MDLFFKISSVMLLLAALGVVLSAKPLHSALWLILTLALQSIVYVALSAPFVAVMQVLVYAGAIMVLFVFVIMLLDLGTDARPRLWFASPYHVAGIAAVVALIVRGIQVASKNPGVAFSDMPNGAGVKAVGLSLLREHMFAFESISILLVVAVLGAVVLGLKNLKTVPRT